MIDIDLTAVVQFVLFLVTLFISNKLLFQPYLVLRERRKAGIEGARNEAELMLPTAALPRRLAHRQGATVGRVGKAPSSQRRRLMQTPRADGPATDCMKTGRCRRLHRSTDCQAYWAERRLNLVECVL